ncbi:MAG: enoyl-CoA hydratase-related protein [Pseudomonadales bacterium]|jgi:2-(1,2-epoxy-1,2-dihydrophenyl)acetyl-CoA isomerase|nr:enoyl-CoA hydratase-related protein [Pseudomonadales bacterium]
MDHEGLRVERRDAVAILTLERPEAANGIDLAMGRALMRTAIALDEDRSVRAVVLTGSGRFFCAGGDLKAFAAFGDALPERLKELTTYLHAAIARFARMAPPVIAAVNGPAAGAGMSLALACDLVIAEDSAAFTLAYTGAGLSPDGSSTWFLPRLIGDQRTRELMLTNRTLSARDAQAWGLITRVVPDDGALPAALELAGELARGPTRAFGAVKALLAESSTNGLESQLDLESRTIAAMAATEDGREGIAAFTEKRPPVFRGR